MKNIWGDDPLMVDEEEFCPNCERDRMPFSGIYRHYNNCDPVMRKEVWDFVEANRREDKENAH